MSRNSFFASTLALTITLLAGCATSDGTAGHSEENAVNHAVNPGDLAALESTTPVKSPRVSLWVNGLGCPQCASNADIQLKRLSGVVAVKTDLSTGKIDVTLTGSRRPSPSQIKEAIEDAGFTLVKAEEVNS